MGPPPRVNTLQRAVSFVLVTAVFAPGIAALGGAFVRITGGGDLSNYWQYWTEWYVANALGNLTLGAMLLTWMGSKPDWSDFGSPLRGLGASLVFAGLGVGSQLRFLSS